MSSGEYLQLKQVGDLFRISFQAMASPCEFLIATDDYALADQLVQLSLHEIRRIEQKFSRYLSGNLCHAINNAQGRTVRIDDECCRLLEFAQTCYELSDGLFDLSSGVLRRVWCFDCSDNVPSQADIDEVLPLVGWEHVQFDKRSLTMRPGMEIDFGAIGKEYAVSRVADIFRQHAADTSALINLGGDIQITRARKDAKPWSVGIEDVGAAKAAAGLLSIVSGALATSGDCKRYLLKDGKRYSHILNPKTGWPVDNAPGSVTVAAPLCVQAGCLATLALLKGCGAEAFLREQELQFWAKRG